MRFIIASDCRVNKIIPPTIGEPPIELEFGLTSLLQFRVHEFTQGPTCNFPMNYKLTIKEIQSFEDNFNYVTWLTAHPEFVGSYSPDLAAINEQTVVLKTNSTDYINKYFVCLITATLKPVNSF